MVPGAQRERLNHDQVGRHRTVYTVHRDLMVARGADYDPLVRRRIERGRDISAADYIAVMRQRAAAVREMDARLADIDAIVMPTAPIVAPTIAECLHSETALARNDLVARNTRIANFSDLCAISLPLPRGDGLPVGLTLIARNGQDRKLYLGGGRAIVCRMTGRSPVRNTVRCLPGRQLRSAPGSRAG
jgi:Asp-tRNA(Asn)/Glu-tRNA(Gln) amidotransferase A subunit family amidase